MTSATLASGRLDLSLSVYSQDGKPVSTFTNTSEIRGFNKQSLGYNEFMKREDFEKSACLVDDSFTIRCDVFVAAVEPSWEDIEGLRDPSPAAIVPLRSYLQKGLANLLWNKQGTDVTIDVGGVERPSTRTSCYWRPGLPSSRKNSLAAQRR
ncbi:hypothetical protein PR202_ga17045 [Eleusine coracana subsp. coracana]|uniref:MATH domain-containing protein n=1 Tax=Eleusine coracana subsp. coracana TaxID=191504 RepID=A0AAV5CNY4_ELECO|nr:hypothetical protein PR202_ga17045 [Eleusine coracana subsp. coracana]